MGSFEVKTEPVGATHRYELVPPIHAVADSEPERALCGAEIREVFSQWRWENDSTYVERCPSCREQADERMPEVEVSPNPFYK